MVQCICKKCNSVHDGTYGSGIYCSRKCANSRTWSDEQKKQRSDISKRLHEEGLYSNVNWKLINSEPERLAKQKVKRDERFQENLQNGKLHNTTLKRYLLTQDAKCQLCGLTEWQGRSINFEMDHIDGNNKNNMLTNVRLLCPNCHSQTDTWRYRNVNKGS